MKKNHKTLLIEIGIEVYNKLKTIGETKYRGLSPTRTAKAIVEDISPDGMTVYRKMTDKEYAKSEEAGFALIFLRDWAQVFTAKHGQHPTVVDAANAVMAKDYKPEYEEFSEAMARVLVANREVCECSECVKYRDERSTIRQKISYWQEWRDRESRKTPDQKVED